MLTPPEVIWIQSLLLGAVVPLLTEFLFGKRLGVLRSIVTAPWVSLFVILFNAMACAGWHNARGSLLESVAKGAAGYSHAMPYIALTSVTAVIGAGMTACLLDMFHENKRSLSRGQTAMLGVFLVACTLSIVLWQLALFIQYESF